MNYIEQIVEWNKKAGNDSFNYTLESNMLAEEFSEAIIALKNRDKLEAIDGILDLFIVGVGTLHKLGISAKQIEACLQEIIESNNSKFFDDLLSGETVCIKNEDGKIIKSSSYFKPDLEGVLTNN